MNTFSYRTVTMERQHSNSSTSSAPGGLNMKLGASDSEDDDNQEISTELQIYLY